MKVKISLLLGSAHEVTIVLFSRTFYDAKHLSEFPPYMQDCLQEVRPARNYSRWSSVADKPELYVD